MIIRYSPAFLKSLKKADVRIRKRVKKRITIFSKNPNDLELNNHPLKDPYQGYRSIDVTADWRAIYKVIHKEDSIAYFIILGTHSQLYK